MPENQNYPDNQPIIEQQFKNDSRVSYTSLAILFLIVTIFTAGIAYFIGFNQGKKQIVTMQTGDSQLPTSNSPSIGNSDGNSESSDKLDSIKKDGEDKTLENWETNTESQLKITFMYPPTWKEQIEVGGTFIVSPDTQTKIIIVGLERKNQSPKEALHNYLENLTSYGDQGLEYVSEQEFAVNGATGWIALVRNTALNQQDKIFLVEDKYNPGIYQGLWIINVTEATKNEADQIISTFKFL